MTVTPWFDLLSEKKILAHLASEAPDPDAAELIIKLIAYAPRVFPTAGTSEVEVVSAGDERRSAVWQSLQQSARAARRVAGLQYRLLAVQVFAHLDWKFTALDKKVALPLQQTLLSTLVTISDRTLPSDPAAHATVDLGRLRPEAVFALSLYHRWTLWNVCQLALPRRPPRTVTVPLPGQQDPAVVMPHVVDAARQQTEALAPVSLALLTQLAAVLPPIVLPTPQCFAAHTEAAPEPDHHWERADAVTSDELLCQLSFELGRFHFFKGRFAEAGQCFGTCERLFRTSPWGRGVTRSRFVCLHEPELAGYCRALSVASTPPARHSLYIQLRSCVQHSYQGVVEVLQEDNVSRQLPITTRDTLARDVAALVTRRDESVPPDLGQKIDVLNCVRRAMDGSHQTVNLSPHLAANAALLPFLLNSVAAAAEASREAATVERLRHLVLRTGQQVPSLVPGLASHKAGGALYSPTELQRLLALHAEADEGLQPEPLMSAPAGRDVAVQIGALERTLMESYSPAQIRSTLQQLAGLQPKRQLWRCNTRWQLPIPVQGVIMALPAGFDRDFFYIMMAKAKELLALKRFERSRSLLQTILEEAQSAQLGAGGAKLVKLIDWEQLLADLLQLLHNWPKLGDYHELTPRAKCCLSALQTGSDVLPRSELLEHCTLYLLNVCEWDHLSELERRWPQIDLAALLSTVCRELVNKGNNRKMSRDLWNAVIPMFTLSGQQKRTAMGAASSIQRDSPHAIMPRTQLMQFIQKVHEHTSLSVLISLLTRLHNILLDDPVREMSLEHAVLWPNVVNDPKLFSLKSASECLQLLLDQGIRLYPSHIPWLQAMADLRYADEEPTSSLRYYLEACLVSSEYFTRPVPRTVLSEAVLRRMIKCCSQLHCYTQAAVLCQFLEEVDYAVAFQYLSERGCADAMDGYYDCIWDMTLLEYLTNMHHRRAERSKRQQVIKLIGQLELNSNNNEEIQREAAIVRKARFLRAMVQQYGA